MAGKASLSGIALVTGAASGIGRETVLAFAEAGVKSVLLADINIKAALAVAEECRTFASNAEFTSNAIKCDVTRETEVSEMVETAVKEYGRLDYYIHSAGLGNIAHARSSDVNTEAFSQTMDTNVLGLMFCIRAVSSVMLKQEPRSYESRRYGKRSLGRGSVVVIASGSSYVAMPGMMAYTASKHAVNGIAKTAALDLIPSGIRVNSVCPGFVDTPMMQASIKRVSNWEALIQTMSPLKRAATPEEIADYIMFLCSPSASYITGTGLLIDAGASMSVAKM